MDITLEQSTRARLITAEETEIPVSATLRYVASDPLAVHLDFPPEVSLDGEGVTWTFARSLLEEGLRRRPAAVTCTWPCGVARTVLEFHSPFGLALLHFRTPELRRFLLRTYDVVATGQEDMGALVDRGLSALFGNV